MSGIGYQGGLSQLLQESAAQNTGATTPYYLARAGGTTVGSGTPSQFWQSFGKEITSPQSLAAMGGSIGGTRFQSFKQGPQGRFQAIPIAPVSNPGLLGLSALASSYRR